MGWTWQCAKFYDRRGNIDRKAECDDLYTWNNEETGDKCRVLKSAMVGATWYGACERTRPGQEPYVFAGVCLTSVDSREYCNFGYKDMDESMGPCERDCPVSILNLLSHRNDEWALEWREDCRNNAAQKAADRKNPNSLQNLPLGAKITVQKRGQNKEESATARIRYGFRGLRICTIRFPTSSGTVIRSAFPPKFPSHVEISESIC